MHAGWLSVVLDSQEPLLENGDTHGGVGLPISTRLINTIPNSEVDITTQRRPSLTETFFPGIIGWVELTAGAN